MKKLNLLRATLLLVSVHLSPTAHAALVTNLNNISIDGALYDVTFHTGTENKFNSLWDSNGDHVFGNDSSVFNAAPTFFGDQAGANLAAAAIIEALGLIDGTISTTSDDFFVGYQYFGGGVGVVKDGDTDVTIDFVFDHGAANGFGLNPAFVFGSVSWVSFQEVSAVPVPAAAWLFGSGLLGLVAVARRKKA